MHVGVKFFRPLCGLWNIPATLLQENNLVRRELVVLSSKWFCSLRLLHHVHPVESRRRFAGIWDGCREKIKNGSEFQPGRSPGGCCLTPVFWIFLFQLYDLDEHAPLLACSSGYQLEATWKQLWRKTDSKNSNRCGFVKCPFQVFIVLPLPL